jgi:hypothetical protein
MNRAAKELKVDAIDFEKHHIVALGLGTHTGKTEGNVRGGQVFKNKHYWEEADWKQLTAVNGMLNVFAHSFTTGRNDFNRLYVSLTLIERWDGQVRFIHQHRPEEVFKGGDPLDK